MKVKWYRDDKMKVNMENSVAIRNVQKPEYNRRWLINIFAAIFSGIDIAPTRRSAIAMLDNSMVDVFFSSLFFWKAKTTRAFKIMTARAAINVIGITIEGNVVSSKSHVKFDACGQRITNLVLLEALVVVTESFMAILTQSGGRWRGKEIQGFGQGMRCNTS